MKKMKVWEKILILVLLVILIIFLVIAWRYNILTNIEQQNSTNLSKTNYYYSSESGNMILQCWKKDGITKINIKQTDRDRDVTFWINTSTGEEYVFYNTINEYSKNRGGILGTRPSSITTSYDNLNKFLLAINPTVYIGTKEYDNKDCYFIKIGEQEELVERETGLLLNTKYGDDERKLTYDFDNVTDEDIQKPDISKYTLQENR